MQSLFWSVLLVLSAVQNIVASNMSTFSHGGLEYIPNEDCMTFKYFTSQDASNNWIGIWSQGVDPGKADGYGTQAAWNWASSKSGKVVVQTLRCLKAGPYAAYYFTYGRDTVLAGPVTFKLDHDLNCDQPNSPKFVSGDSSVCADGTLCHGNNAPQCTIDNKGESVCCARGRKAINGKCYHASANLCSDGTICSGATPQCTPNSDFPLGGRQTCCTIGQYAVQGICGDSVNTSISWCHAGKGAYNSTKPGRGAACNASDGYYCAWDSKSRWSRCCRLNEYLPDDGSRVCKLKPTP